MMRPDFIAHVDSADAPLRAARAQQPVKPARSGLPRYSTPQTPGIVRSSSLVVIALFVASCAFRFIGLNRYGFNGDELISIDRASEDWTSLLQTTVDDISHPPLFYGLLKLWLAIGPLSETWVRLLPAVLGVAAFIPLYKICGLLRLDITCIALIMALFAANGMLISYAPYARMFSLLQLLSTVSIHLFAKFLAGDRSRTTLVLLTVANVLLVYSHYWGWIVIISEFAGCVILTPRRVPTFFGSLVVVGLGFAPWAIAVAMAILRKGSATSQIKWMGETDSILSPIWLLGDLNGTYSFSHSTIVAVMLFALPLPALLPILRKRPPANEQEPVSPLIWILLVVLPIILTLFIGYAARQSVWGARHLSIVAAPYFLLIGVAVSRIQWKRVAAAMPYVLALWAIGAGLQGQLSPDPTLLSWRSFAAAMTASDGARHPIVVHTLEGYVARPLRFYLSRNSDSAVVTTSDAALDELGSSPSWLVYRENTWPYREGAAAMLTQRGFVIDRKVSIGNDFQRVTGLLIHRPS